jgi:uncharacterized protein (DUF983 family)
MKAPGRRAQLVRTALRGLRGCCPSCGARTLFRAYLKLNVDCPRCGADFSRSETADVAPYLTVFLIGLIATPLTFFLSLHYAPLRAWAVAALLGGFLALALVLLPRIKGMLAALLWRAQREM